eukprot:gene37500-46264_t
MLSSEAIGSIPRTLKLQAAYQSGDAAEISTAQREALEETINELKSISASNPISDGEQTKSSFATYSIYGLQSLKHVDGVTIPFADVEFLLATQAVAGPDAKIKQAVISASAMSLLYPPEPIADYSREQFIEDVVKNAMSSNVLEFMFALVLTPIQLIQLIFCTPPCCHLF